MKKRENDTKQIKNGKKRSGLIIFLEECSVLLKREMLYE